MNYNLNSVQRAACSVQRAACSVQRAACSVQRAACSVQRAAFFGTLALLTSTGCESTSNNPDTSSEPATELRTLTQALSSGNSDLPPGYGFEHETQVPPPRIARPVYHCVQSVFVESCIDNSKVRVYDSQGNQLGQGVCSRSGSVDITLSNPLDGEEALYATQEIDTYTSLIPSEMTPVEQYTSTTIHAPRINHDVYECSRIFRGDGIVPGATVEVSHNTSANWNSSYEVPRAIRFFRTLGGSKVGQGEIGNQIQVRQIMCPSDIATTSAWHSTSTVAEPSTIPTPADINGSFGAQGSDQFYASNLLIGARVSMFTDSVPTLYGNYTAYSEIPPSLPSIFGINRFPLAYTDTIDPNWQISAQQELCTPSARSPELPPANPETPGVLNAPKIVGPICEGARWVDVDTTTPGAFVTVEKSNPMSISADSGRVRLQIPDAYDLVEDDTVYAYHVFKSGIKSSPDSDTVVATGSSFDVIGSRDYTDQDTGDPIPDAFVRESSPGPIFELRECCDGARTDAELGMDINDAYGSTVATIVLKKQQNGFYKGQWNWYELADQGTPLPYPNIEYTAVAVDSCASTTPEITFNVVTGQAEPGDATAPTPKVTVTVDGQSQVTDGVGTNTFDVSPGHDVDIRYSGLDFLGVKQIDLVVSGDHSGTDSKSHPEQVPLPGFVEDIYTANALSPGEQVEVEVTAEDYSGNTSGIAKVIVNALAAQPTITSISPDPVWSHDTNGNSNTIDIQGSELWFSGTTTDIEFRNADTNALIHTESGFAGNGANALKNVPLPGAIGGMDEVTLIVKVDNVASNAFTLNLNDREDSFSIYTKGDFVATSTTKSCPSNSSDPYAIDRVVTSGNAQGLFVTVYFNDNPQQGYSNVIASPIYGEGLLLDTTSCKSIATWGTQGSQNHMNFYYFDENTNRTQPNFAQISNFGVENASVGISSDGTIGIITSYDSIADGLANAIDVISNLSIIQGFSTACFLSCNFTYHLEYGRRVVIKESGQEETSGVIQ